MAITEEDFEAFTKRLKNEYFLIKKENWLLFMGGSFGFVITAGIITYQASLQAIRTAGVQSTIGEIKRAKEEADKEFKQILNLRNELESKLASEDEKLIKETANLLKDDSQFIDFLKGERGLQGSPGEGIKKGDYGDYIKFYNSEEERIIYLGANNTKSSMMKFYNEQEKLIVSLGSDVDGNGYLKIFDKNGQAIGILNNSGFLVKNIKYFK